MSFRLKNTEIYLEKKAQKLIGLTRREINEPRKRSYPSGRIINEPIATRPNRLSKSLKLDTKISKSGNKIQFNIMGNAYGEKVDEGTPAGTTVKPSVIEKWIKHKPVSLDDGAGNNLKSVAINISNKINKQGIKPTNFLRDLVNKQFKTILGIDAVILSDVNEDIDGFLKSIGYDQTGNAFKLKNK